VGVPSFVPSKSSSADRPNTENLFFMFVEPVQVCFTARVHGPARTCTVKPEGAYQALYLKDLAKPPCLRAWQVACASGLVEGGHVCVSWQWCA